MKENIIKIEATGDFPFTFYIEKAIPTGTDEEMSIKGVASTVNIDHDNERMSPESLHAMADIINEKSVPLRLEHQKDDNSIVGKVHKAWVDERNQLWIEANLDKSHSGASILYKMLKTGGKMGLSVGGRVKHAVKEFSESAGKMIKTFYNVVLDEVSVTSRPANYDAWLVSKSIIKKGESGDHFVDSPIYREFLFETPVYDYLQSFAKSIPDDSWKKVEINKNNENKFMTKKEEEVKKEETKEEETKEKAETKDETETKEKKENGKKEDAATEDTAFKSMVLKGFESLAAMIGKLAKTDSTKETEKTEETTIMEDKEKAETKDETETKEKAEDGKKEEETTSEKGNSEYQIKMKSILKQIEDLSKAMDDTDTKEETKEKAEDKKEDKTTEKSQELDEFVATITKSVEALQEKFAKGGKRTLGLTEMIVNAIRNDAEVQKEIQGMMKEAGFKKSMQFGSPYMRTKDGKSYRLTATVDGEEVAKSKDGMKGKSFKEVYNQNFSSSASREE